MAGKALRVRRGNDPVPRAPDDEYGDLRGREGVPEERCLRATGKEIVRELAERGVHALEPLVLEEIVDELPRHQCLVRVELRHAWLERIAGRGAHEALDVARVDLAAQSGATDERQGTDAPGRRRGDRQRHGAAQGVTNEMRAL